MERVLGILKKHDVTPHELTGWIVSYFDYHEEELNELEGEQWKRMDSIFSEINRLNWLTTPKEDIDKICSLETGMRARLRALGFIEEG